MNECKVMGVCHVVTVINIARLISKALAASEIVPGQRGEGDASPRSNSKLLYVDYFNWIDRTGALAACGLEAA